MKAFSKIELLLILALYYFDKGKNIDSFTDKMNSYFGQDISAQSVLFSVSKFRSVDPANNNSITADAKVYYDLWNEYIENEKITDLKRVYQDFKKGRFIVEDNIGIQIESKSSGIKSKIEDLPQEKPEYDEVNHKWQYPRSHEVVENALFIADYLCELECGSVLFERKNDTCTYTEAHHLIPLKYQEYFGKSLDVEANVVSLCPACHRKLHYGKDYEGDIEKIYFARSKRLHSCGIEISLEELLILYR